MNIPMGAAIGILRSIEREERGTKPLPNPTGLHLLVGIDAQNRPSKRGKDWWTWETIVVNIWWVDREVRSVKPPPNPIKRTLSSRG